jgi:hypothetical protein
MFLMISIIRSKSVTSTIAVVTSVFVNQGKTSSLVLQTIQQHQHQYQQKYQQNQNHTLRNTVTYQFSSTTAPKTTDISKATIHNTTNFSSENKSTSTMNNIEPQRQGPVEATIQQNLVTAFQPIHLQIINESHRHNVYVELNVY